VDPVVDSPEKSIRIVLDVPFEVAVIGPYDLPAVRAHVTIGIAHEPEIRGRGDKHPLLQNLHRPGQDEGIHEDGSPVHLTIAVPILQYDDPPDRSPGPLVIEVRHVSRHFDDPETPIGVEFDGNRIADERLCSYKLDPEAGGEPEGFKRLIPLENRSNVATGVGAIHAAHEERGEEKRSGKGEVATHCWSYGGRTFRHGQSR
jgi:hypothetical protein